MKIRIFSLASLLAVLFAPSPGFASNVTFDDIDASTLPVLSTYAGFNWGNIFAYPDTLTYDAYPLGVVSPHNAAATFSDTIATITSTTPFNFDSGYFGAAHYDGLNVTVTGLLNNVQKFSQNIIVGTTGAQSFLFNFTNINEIDIQATTHTGDPFECGDSNCGSVTMDNLSFNNVPEPTTITLVSLSLAIAIGLGRRKQALVA